MLLLIPVLFLLIAPIAMFGMRSVRNGFTYQWLIAFFSLGAVSAYLLFLRARLPVEELLAAGRRKVHVLVAPVRQRVPVVLREVAPAVLQV